MMHILLEKAVIGGHFELKSLDLLDLTKKIHFILITVDYTN